MHEALFYESTENAAVRCTLCPHACLIPDGKRGLCCVRENRSGRLYSLVFGKPIAEHSDPIEKKPLFHVLPGSRTYSLGTAGCNLSCAQCQNADIAHLPRRQALPDITLRSAEAIISAATASGCSSIACTYTEPTIYYEYMLAIAELATQQGLKTVVVTNGYISAHAIEKIAPFIDAVNIDLKAFSDEFYRTICKARLQPVLDAIKQYHQSGIWCEITTLIIPGLNDTVDELQKTAGFIASVGEDIPWHVSAFYPTYLMTDRPPTQASALHAAREIGLSAGLRHVYTGNIAGQGGEDTLCHACGACLIRRNGYNIQADRVHNGTCPECGTTCPGIFT